MPESCPVIDYEDMLSDLNDDIESGFIKEDVTLFIVRMKNAVLCEAFGGEVRPVIDYFYDSPALYPELKEITVSDCKKLCFAALEKLQENEDESLKAAVSLIIEDLKDYTAGNNKRNERLCKVIFEQESLIPLMVYFDDTDAGDEVEAITAGDLIKELRISSGQ
ncbi:MAG: hypothetical protein IJ757_06620 [Clostridiales bacterium]|nr:hypothetical protein [Clostridiales bacterium]